MLIERWLAGLGGTAAAFHEDTAESRRHGRRAAGFHRVPKARRDGAVDGMVPSDSLICDQSGVPPPLSPHERFWKICWVENIQPNSDHFHYFDL